MPEPKDTAPNNKFMFFQNKECPYWMCHTGVPEEQFSCLHCFCPLAFLECPGPFEVYVDKHGNKRKDCSRCVLNHRGLEKSWNFVNRWLENPKPWNGEPQTEQRMKAAVPVEHPRKPSCPNCGSDTFSIFDTEVLEYEADAITYRHHVACERCNHIWTYDETDFGASDEGC